MLGATMLFSHARTSSRPLPEAASAPFALAPSDVEAQLHDLRRRVFVGEISRTDALEALSLHWGITPTTAAVYFED